jgi:serine/threonine protein kinase
MSEADNDLLARALGRVGDVLRGKYRLDSVLGVGGMAVVYAATHRNKKRFAVKMLHRELSLEPEIRARFLREGYAANSVEHPDAVAVLDDDVDEEGAAFLVMELLDGETAEELCARSGEKLPLAVAVSIGHRVLDVLASAHAHGVVHRDVKPANLFLTRRGEVKLLDFGVARVRDAAASQATQTGAVMGTAGFMAPEQALGRTPDVDALTDVWAVGATVFSLASGQRVHEGDSAQETIVLAATQPAPSLANVVAGAPPAIVQVIDRALSFDKAARWPGAIAMREALRVASVGAFGGLAPIPSLPPRLEEGPSSGETRQAFSPGSAAGATRAPLPRRWRRRGALLAVLAAALAFGVARIAERGSVARDTPRDPSPDTGLAVAPPVVDRPPPMQAPAASPATSKADPPAASAATVRAPSAGDATTSSSKAPSRAVPTAKATPPSSSSPASSSSPPLGARCVPPYFFDAQGNRVFKKECL